MEKVTFRGCSCRTAKMLGLYQKCVDMSDDEYVKWSERARGIWASGDERAIAGHP